MNNLSLIKHRVALHLKGRVDVTGGTEVLVRWIEMVGGELDPLSGAMVEGEEQPVSGVLKAFGSEEPARSVLRQHTEIQAGDLLLDVDPEGLVELLPGQPLSGVISLDAIAKKGVRFEWGGCEYSQAQVGEDLAASWNVIVQGVRLSRTLLLRRAT